MASTFNGSQEKNNGDNFMFHISTEAGCRWLCGPVWILHWMAGFCMTAHWTAAAAAAAIAAADLWLAVQVWTSARPSVYLYRF